MQERITHAIRKRTRDVAPLLSSGILLFATACGSDPISKNLDCNSDQKSSSTTIFLKKGEQKNVKGLPVKSSSQPGTIEIIPDKISKDIKAIKFNPDATIQFTLSDQGLNSLLWWDKKNHIYTISGQPASKNNIEGTNITIRADCPNKK